MESRTGFLKDIDAAVALRESPFEIDEFQRWRSFDGGHGPPYS
jgi:hypothetical protein